MDKNPTYSFIFYYAHMVVNDNDYKREKNSISQ